MLTDSSWMTWLPALLKRRMASLCLRSPMCVAAFCVSFFLQTRAPVHRDVRPSTKRSASGCRHIKRQIVSCRGAGTRAASLTALPIRGGL